MTDGTWRVGTVNFEEHAKEIVLAMREQGVDPARIAEGQILTGKIMLSLIDEGY